ncbi:MAG: hypothetical protein QNJ46_23000 [Leptolyngbyaceae cyanobacterium MO_188.B28]|nr:hypothetical protein [Leptolyngbyaceae cyanobacterium MO_188.B28]
MTKLLITIIPAVWIAAIAVISVQNATPVSLKFITFRTIEMPMGVAMGFCAAGGMVGTAVLLTLFGGTSKLKL